MQVLVNLGGEVVRSPNFVSLVFTLGKDVFCLNVVDVFLKIEERQSLVTREGDLLHLVLAPKVAFEC